MTTYPAPICLWCVHFIPEAKGMTCTAFPEGIPEAIVLSRVFHTAPYPGDQGIAFQDQEGREAQEVIREHFWWVDEEA